MPPKVLHYLDTENYAGTEAHVLTLLRSLDRDLYSPALLCRPSTVLHERAQAAGIPCYPGGNLADMVRLLRQERFALIHAHDGNSKLHAVLAARLARTGTHVVATQHFVQPAYTQRGGWKGRVAKSIHHAVNGLVAAHIAVSRAVLEAALERREVRETRVTVIPNGIIIPDAVSPATISAKRTELGIPASVPVIATVARLSPEKGIASLLQAVAELRRSSPKFHLLIIGEGDLHSRLETEAATLDLQEHIHFLGFRPDVLDWVASSDIFVLPSLAEPFGIALVEAMALSKPTVAVCIGGPLEIVENGVTGLLVPPADPHSLAQAIQRLLEHPEQARTMGQAGQRRAAEHFSAAAMARRTEAVYQNCLSQNCLSPAADRVGASK